MWKLQFNALSFQGLPVTCLVTHLAGPGHKSMSEARAWEVDLLADAFSEAARTGEEVSPGHLGHCQTIDVDSRTPTKVGAGQDPRGDSPPS